MRLLYNIFVIPILYIVFHIGALFNQKIRKGVKGRKGLLKKIKSDLKSVSKRKIWFHIASYGEFEQAKPVLRLLKQQQPDIFIIVSFFSPSGFEHIKREQPVDYKCYIPFDSIAGAFKFISIVNPAVGVVVRHDIWPNFMWVMKKKRIPLILIDASIPPTSSRLWPVLRNFNRTLFNKFTRILTTSNLEMHRLRLLVSNDEKLAVTGDTKFDQVFHRAMETNRIESLLANKYLSSHRILIAGSSWPSDEERLIPVFKNVKNQVDDALLIIVPHEPIPHRIEEISDSLDSHNLKWLVYSEMTGESTDYDVLIIDKIGFLANLYKLGIAAFIGGSFTQKVHNVLEPAAHGIPVLVGPKITTQAEATRLVDSGGAIIVNSPEEFEVQMTRIYSDNMYQQIVGKRAKFFVEQHLGASEKTVEIIVNYL